MSWKPSSCPATSTIMMKGAAARTLFGTTSCAQRGGRQPLLAEPPAMMCCAMEWSAALHSPNIHLTGPLCDGLCDAAACVARAGADTPYHAMCLAATRTPGLSAHHASMNVHPHTLPPTPTHPVPPQPARLVHGGLGHHQVVVQPGQVDKRLQGRRQLDVGGDGVPGGRRGSGRVCMSR